MSFSTPLFYLRLQLHFYDIKKKSSLIIYYFIFHTDLNVFQKRFKSLADSDFFKHSSVLERSLVSFSSFS